jgi:hypothetical protein
MSIEGERHFKFLSYVTGARYVHTVDAADIKFGKFQDTERSLIPCPRHASSRLPPSGKICKYTMTPSTHKSLERFSTYSYAAFCCVCLGCCAAELGISVGTYDFLLRLDYGRSPHKYVNQRLQRQLELLMMSGVPLETC